MMKAQSMAKIKRKPRERWIRKTLGRAQICTVIMTHQYTSFKNLVLKNSFLFCQNARAEQKKKQNIKETIDPDIAVWS
jgi:hypothetical protein